MERGQGGVLPHLELDGHWPPVLTTLELPGRSVRIRRGVRVREQLPFLPFALLANFVHSGAASRDSPLCVESGPARHLQQNKRREHHEVQKNEDHDRAAHPALFLGAGEVGEVNEVVVDDQDDQLVKNVNQLVYGLVLRPVLNLKNDGLQRDEVEHENYEPGLAHGHKNGDHQRDLLHDLENHDPDYFSLAQ